MNTTHRVKKFFLPALLLLSAAMAQAQAPAPGIVQTPPVLPTGSASFCLFDAPPEESGKRRLVNLAHVQYVEVVGNEVRFYYGGGNLGSGHETRIPTASPADAGAVVERMRRTAANCTVPRSPGQG